MAHDPEELIAIVDENDNVVGVYPRRNHADGQLHRETAVFILNEKNEILIQERTNSGRLDYSAAGHFPHYENYLDGIIREVQEELGIKIDKLKFIKIAKHRVNIEVKGRPKNDRFVTFFEVKGNYNIEDFKIEEEEVKSIKYYSIKELKKIMKQEPERLTRGFPESLKIYLRIKNTEQ